MVPTPTTMDHVERKSTNKTPSTGKLNYETNKSVSLDRWVRMWPTQDSATERTKEYSQGETPLTLAVQREELWPTPRVSMANGPSAKEVAQGNPKRRLETEVELWQTPVADDSVDRAKGKWNSRGEPKLSAQVKLWPTPTKQDASNNGGPSQHKRNSLPLNTAVLYPMQQVVADPKSGGKLNPQWVAWLMGYPTEYLNSVPWETRSSRKSRKK
jgi:hypothetical protein